MLLNPFLAVSAVGASGGLATFNDTFTYTENPISHGGLWATSIGGLSAIKTNGTAALGATASVDCGARVVTPSFAANQKATITTGGTAADISAAVRFDASGNGYIAYIVDSVTVQIYKITGNGVTFTQNGADITVATIFTGDTLGLSASGTGTVTLTLYKNGTSVTTRTDSSSPWNSGQPGIHTSGNVNTITTFDATDI